MGITITRPSSPLPSLFLLLLLSISSLLSFSHAVIIERDEALDLSKLPLANKGKITRFMKNVESRYANTANIPADKWSAASPAQRLDMTIAQDDNKVQADILKQLADAFKAGLDQVGKLINTASSGSRRQPSTSKQHHRALSNSNNNNLVLTIPLKDMVLSEQQDAEYFAQVQIGTPPRTYLMQVDTGSSDPWIPSVRCTSKACLGVNGARARYNTSLSSSFSPSPSNKTFELYYSIGAVKGRMVRDNFSFKGIAASNGGASTTLTVRAQTFGLARELTPDFATDHTDGVLGLGFRALTVAGEKPILENLFAQNAQRLKAKSISFYLGRASSGTAARSEMRIGEPNRALYKGELAYVPLTKRAYWSFRFGRFGIAGASKRNSVSGADSTGLEGIVDTGTSYIAMPYGNAADFWNAVPGAQSVGAYGYWVYDCKMKLSAEFTLPNGTKFKLNPADLNAGVAYKGSSNCIGTIFSADTGNQVIFGASLLKSVYTVFDWGASRIGFATAV